MATTADYLAQLQADKQTLVDNLVAKGVEASNEETFTTLAPKVADIPSGGASFVINDCRYLFYADGRNDLIDLWLPLISPECSNFAYMFDYCDDLTGKIKIDTSNATGSSAVISMFRYCRKLEEIEIDAKNVTSLDRTFQDCNSATKIIVGDTSQVKSFFNAFYTCKVLENLQELDMSSATNIQYAFYDCHALTNIGGFKDLGKAYSTTTSENGSYYAMELNKAVNLTYESLMNVINKLYDIATKGCNPQKLRLPSTAEELLSDEDVAIATNKGWNVVFG